MPPSGSEDTSLVLQVLRALRGWDQSEFAEAAKVSQGTISRYESGERMKPNALARATAAAGLPLDWVERRLLPVLRAARKRAVAAEAESASGGGRTPAPDLLPRTQAALAEEICDVINAVATELEADIEALEVAERRGNASLSPADREAAAEAWQRLAPCSAAERHFLVEECSEFQRWALVELLCEESARAAAKDAGAALDLARLAVFMAQLVHGDELWRRRLLGYARVFLANALRVAGELTAALTELAAAWALWRDSGESDPAGLLEEWRLFDLEASLRRDARQFAVALDLLERAVAAAPMHALGRILLNRASTLEQSGDVAGAVAVLREAAPLVANGDKPHLSWLLEFNLCVNLCHLHQYEEVEAQLPRLRQLAGDLGNDIDLVRVHWLSARTAAGAGRHSEACTAFEQVRTELEARSDAFGTAMVSLELAQLYLDEGRTAEVRELAAAMAWVLAAKGLERETVAALRLFCDAARREKATLDQARRVLGLLERSGAAPLAAIV
jgi:transcriptional regulator with XRE-family HTH domain